MLATSLGLAGVGLAVLAVGAFTADQGWRPFTVDDETSCADGSDVGFLERRADPERVVLYFEGGGACFSAETCAFDSDEKTYVSSSPQTAEFLIDRGGIFDFEHAENPVGEYSFVYVPYCTGDGHLGTATHRYRDGLVVEHKGFVNATAAFDHLIETYPDVRELVITGASAGSIPTPLFAGLAADRSPDTRIVTMGDSSGAYPDVPALNGLIGDLWGAGGAIPDWPETAGLKLDRWSVPGLYTFAGQHAPDVTFARFDFAADEAQAFYGDLVGVDTDELVTLIDDIEAGIEASGVNVASYVAPGTAHTIINGDDFYTLEVDGVRFVDWMSELVNGGTPDDVHCRVCE